MKKIYFSIILFLFYILLNSLALLFSFKLYIENKFPTGASISFKKGVLLINDKNYNLFDLEVAQSYLLVTNIIIVVFFYYYNKNTGTIKSIFNNIDAKKTLLSIAFFLPFLVFSNFAENLELFKNDIAFKISFNNSYVNNALLFLNVVVLMPFIEEIIFRALILEGIIDVFKKKYLAILLSSFLFSLVHIQYNTSVMILLFFFSILSSIIYLKFDKNIFYPFIIHAINNFIATLISNS